MLKFQEEFFNEQKAFELSNLIIEAVPKIYTRHNHFLKDYVKLQIKNVQ